MVGAPPAIALHRARARASPAHAVADDRGGGGADDGAPRRRLPAGVAAAVRARVAGAADGAGRRDGDRAPRGQGASARDEHGRRRSMHIGLPHFLVLSAVLFGLGLLTVATRRNAVAILMGVELILNAAALNFVAFSHYVARRASRGMVFALFIIVLAAAEAAIALAIVLAIFRHFHSIDAQRHVDARRTDVEPLTARCRRSRRRWLWLIPLLPLVGAARQRPLRRGAAATASARRAVTVVAIGVMLAAAGLAHRRRRAAGRAAGRTRATSSTASSPCSHVGQPARRLRASRSIRSSAVMMLVITVVGTLIHIYADRLHGRRAGLLALLRLPEPVRLLDAAAGPRRQLRHDVLRLGGRRPLQLPAHRLLVQGVEERERRHEGVRRQPRRRLGLHRRRCCCSSGRSAARGRAIDHRYYRRRPQAHGRGRRRAVAARRAGRRRRRSSSASCAQLPSPTPGARPLADALRQDALGRRRCCSLVALLLFLGACGKSAQIPLYVWLPDAMAGPTPVSALIHAATMVTAGVYMIARLRFLFVLSPAAMTSIACVGVAHRARSRAVIGLFQYDIKKVLAYSTVSQLGFMFIGVGVGACWARRCSTSSPTPASRPACSSARARSSTACTT